jgi:hypothetical protein
MSATHNIISSVVVLLVLRQIREARLDLASLLLPVALVGRGGCVLPAPGTHRGQRRAA